MIRIYIRDKTTNKTYYITFSKTEIKNQEDKVFFKMYPNYEEIKRKER